MNYFANYNPDTGEILGFYTPEIHGNNIPEPNIEISEKEWVAALEAKHIVKDGKLRLYKQSAEETAELERQQRIDEIKKVLSEIDEKSTRAIRSMLAAIASGKKLDSSDAAKLTELENQALTLRKELNAL